MTDTVSKLPRKIIFICSFEEEHDALTHYKIYIFIDLEIEIMLAGEYDASFKVTSF